jgi:hypothetical protein
MQHAHLVQYVLRRYIIKELFLDAKYSSFKIHIGNARMLNDVQTFSAY